MTDNPPRREQHRQRLHDVLGVRSTPTDTTDGSLPDPPTVYVRVYRSVIRTATGRPQPWRWKAKRARNHKTLAVSSEAYTNRYDALAAVETLFGDRTAVMLVGTDGERGTWLRRPAR